MADNYGPAYVCTLSPELKSKAKKELNETDKDRPKKINSLRKKVLAHPGKVLQRYIVLTDLISRNCE